MSVCYAQNPLNDQHLSGDNLGETSHQTSGQLTAPRFEGWGGYYEDFTEIEITSRIADVEIRYTIDNTPVTAESPLYTRPFRIFQSTTVRARAFKENWEPSTEIKGDFIITNVPENFTASIYRGFVHFSWTQPRLASNPQLNIDDLRIVGYHIYLNKLDLNSSEQATPIKINDTYIHDTQFSVENLEIGDYQAYVHIWYNKNIASVSETINFSISKVPPPRASHSSGLYYEAQEIELIHDFAEIYYSLDGSVPSETSMKYTHPIKLPAQSESALRYRAYHQNLIPSDPQMIEIKITDTVKAPVFNLPTGTHFQPFYLFLYCETPQVTIYYTTDGATPDSLSAIYSTPLLINNTTTVKAIAKRKDWLPSPITTSDYEIINIEIEIEPPPKVYETKLISAFPNPFNQNTTISFSLSAEETNNHTPVNIEIYNILGQKIITLINETIKTGEYELIWDGTDENGNDTAKGVYFCRMRTATYNDMLKIVYVR